MIDLAMLSARRRLSCAARVGPKKLTGLTSRRLPPPPLLTAFPHSSILTLPPTGLTLERARKSTRCSAATPSTTTACSRGWPTTSPARSAARLSPATWRSTTSVSAGTGVSTRPPAPPPATHARLARPGSGLRLLRRDKEHPAPPHTAPACPPCAAAAQRPTGRRAARKMMDDSDDICAAALRFARYMAATAKGCDAGYLFARPPREEARLSWPRRLTPRRTCAMTLP